jgi:prephenate dehydratase
VRGIDLTRIESRPIKDRHAEYWFHLDCTGHIADPAMGEALARCTGAATGCASSAPIPGPGSSNGTAPGVGAPAVPEHGTDAAAFAAAERWLADLRSGART